jgi:hypothetical protein
MALNWGQGQSGNTNPVTPAADNNFTVPQTGSAAVAGGQYVNLTQTAALDAAVLARIDAPTLDVAAAHAVGAYRTWTDHLVYECVTAALAGETPASAAAKWAVRGTSKALVDAGNAAVLARVPAPTLVTTVAHIVGDRRTWTDGLIYVCAAGGAAVGETPATHPAKWVVWDVTKTTVDAIDTRVLALEGGGAASLPVTTQSNTVPGGLVLNQRILVGPLGTGFFSGFNNQVATVTNPATPTFTFAAPPLGRTLFVTGATIADGSGVSLTYNGTAWEASAASFVASLVSPDANAGLAANQAPLIIAKIDAPVFDPLATYAIGKRTTWTDGFVYEALVLTTAGDTPVSAAAKWTLKRQVDLVTVKTAHDRSLPVLSKTITAQPASPAAGDRYLVPFGATGVDWASQVGKIATYSGTAWSFDTPTNGLRVFVISDKYDVIYTASGWNRDGSDIARSTTENLATVAVSGGVQFMPLFDAAGIPVGKASVTAIASNGSIPAAEFGSVDLAATFAYSNAPTWVDVPGMTVTLTSAGTWEIRGQIRGEAKDEQDNNVVALFDETVSTTVPVAGSECNIGFVAGTNNLTDPVWFSSAYLFRATVSAAKSYKLKARRDAGTNGTNMVHSDSNGRSRLVWEKVSGFTPLVSAIVMQSGEAQLATATQTVSTTDIDLAGCVTPVLGAGLWRIDMYVSGTDTSASNIYAWITDQANAIVPNSSVTVSNDGAASSHGASAHISCDVTSDGSKSYKLRGRGSASATIANVDHISATNNGSCTKIRWTKIAGNVPLSNNAESVLAISDNGTGTAQISTSNTYIDITNAVLTLPSAGEWEVNLDTFVFNGSAGALQAVWVAITDMAGTILGERKFPAMAASHPSPLTVTIPSIVIGGAAMYKAMWKMEGSGTMQVLNANTSGALRPRFWARKIGALASIPGSVAEVSNAMQILSNQTTAANTTPIDAGMQFIAPEAGTYEVSYEAKVSNAAAGGSVDTYVTDGSNNVQESSRRRIVSVIANAQMMVVGSCRMVLAAGDVAKVRMASAGANIATMYGTAVEGYGVMRWRKVTNYGAVAVRDPEIGYFRLTAGITAVAAANLQGAWAAEAGFANTIQQVSVGGLPVFRLKAGRLYNLELYPYITGVGAGLYDFWEWRTVAGVALPATAMGGSAYASATGLSREEMGAVVKGWVRPTIDTDVTVYCTSVSGGSLAAESSSRSTSIFINEMPSKILV